MNIYDIRRYGTWILLAIAMVMVGFFLLVSNRLVNDLTAQERERMEVWAGATRQMARVTTAAMDSEQSEDIAADDLEFLLSILAGNHTIPVLLTDDNGTIIDQRNFDLPEPVDSLAPATTSYRLSSRPTTVSMSTTMTRNCSNASVTTPTYNCS